MGLTATSGPGIALKSEAMGLAVMVELPLVIVDVQRAGPSTGMPTKTEQADLLQVMFGRNGDSPMPVVAPATPADCFDVAIEAWRIALKYMTPVVYLSDAFLATGSEPWRIPNVADLPRIDVENATDRSTFHPYARDPQTLARPWAVPGTPGLEHRIGGLEKADITGNVSYDPDNHHRMTMLRAEKVAGIANDIPEAEAVRASSAASSSSSAGARPTAPSAPPSSGCSRRARASPTSTCATSTRCRATWATSWVATGTCSCRRSTSASCCMLLRAKYLVDAIGYNKVRGKPFRIAEIDERAEQILAGR